MAAIAEPATTNEPPGEPGLEVALVAAPVLEVIAPPPVERTGDGVQAAPIPASIVAVTGVLTGLCILFALALCLYVISGAIHQRPSEVTIRLLMSCIACFIAMAFASLGFGLFLVGARGSFRARFGEGTAHPALIESTAPGLIVVVCATVVMWLALRVRFEITSTNGPTAVDMSRLDGQPMESGSAAPPPPHITDGVQAP